jgi:hypothetical protein
MRELDNLVGRDDAGFFVSKVVMRELDNLVGRDDAGLKEVRQISQPQEFEVNN